MRAPLHHLLRLCTAAVLLGLLGACGGGAAGPADGLPPALAGAYHVLIFQADVGGGAMISGSARYDADASGNLTGGTTWVAGDGDPDPGTAPSLTYEVAEDRTLTLLPQGGDSLVGRIATDGSIAVASALEDGANPVLVLMMRRHAAPTLADLEGQWLRAEVRSLAGGVDYRVALSQVTITAGGSHVPGGSTSKKDGVLTVVPPPSGPVEVTSGYSIDAEGWVRLASSFPPGPDDSIGALSADGNVLLMGQQPDATGAAAIRIYVRVSTMPQPGAFAGSHAVITTGKYGVDVLTGGGTLAFDQTGQGPFSLTYNVMGGIEPELAGDAELLPIASDHFGMVLDSALAFEGPFTPDRRLGVFAGHFDNGGPAQLLILLR